MFQLSHWFVCIVLWVLGGTVRSVATRRWRPRVEQFESREVPAILTVETDADTGAKSLRERIKEANMTTEMDQFGAT